jgi:hypothetical protein
METKLMFKLLIDTSVWLELAKNHKQASLLETLEFLVREGQVSFILPRTIINEFERNKARIIEESSRSLSSSLKRAKEIVDMLGEGKGKRLALEQLNDVDYRLPQLGETAVTSIGRIESLFATSQIIETSDAVLLRAGQRAIERRAPFHRQRNSIEDAILIETYIEYIKDKTAAGIRFGFVTHNTKDFSHPTEDNRLPHPDIAPCFSRIKSLYLISLADALKRIEPKLISEEMLKQEFLMEPKRLSEILDSIDEFTDKIWYDRHQLRQQMIEDGKIELVEKETFPVKDHTRRPIQKNIWQGALKSAKRAYSTDVCHPIHGKVATQST